MKVKELINILEKLNQESEIGIRYFDDIGDSFGEYIECVADRDVAEVQYGEDLDYYIC